MRVRLALASATLLYSVSASADINLDCERLAHDMIARLAAEGLLTGAAEGSSRVREITLELCGGAEASAQRQHETGKQQALDNWFFEDRPEKSGNRRLRKLKR